MKRLSLILAVCLLLGTLGACGKKAQEPAMAGEGTFGAAGTESAVDSAEDAAPAAMMESGSFSMPYNASYGWDPFECIGMENRAVMDLIYEGLFVLNGSFVGEPVLCESYTLSDDGYTFTLQLRQATFSNGKAMTAQDVIYSMNKAQASSRYGGRFTDVSFYEASGNDQVIIHMSSPNDRLPGLLTFPIIPSSSVSDGAAGTGPFVRNGEYLLVNKDWWGGSENLNIQSVRLYSSASAEDTRDAFEIDSVHLVYNNPNAPSSATYHSDYELWNSRGTVMQYIGFNFNYGIFQDEGVRTAVTRAIDRVSIAEQVYHNFADAAVLPAHPASTVYAEDLAQKYAFTSSKKAMEELKTTASFYLPEGYDPEGAAPVTKVGTAALETEEEAEPEEEAPEEDTLEEESEEDSPEEDAPKTKKVTGEYNKILMLVMSGNTFRLAAAKEVAQCLTDVGFTVTIQELDREEFTYYLNATDWDIYYGEVTLQPDFDLRPLLMRGGSLTYGGYGGSETMDNLLRRSRENSGNCYDLFQYIMEQGLLCPVLFVNNAVFTTRGVFTGLNPSPSSVFYDITNIQVHHG